MKARCTLFVFFLISNISLFAHAAGDELLIAAESGHVDAFIALEAQGLSEADYALAFRHAAMNFSEVPAGDRANHVTILQRIAPGREIALLDVIYDNDIVDEFANSGHVEAVRFLLNTMANAILALGQQGALNENARLQLQNALNDGYRDAFRQGFLEVAQLFADHGANDVDGALASAVDGASVDGVLLLTDETAANPNAFFTHHTLSRNDAQVRTTPLLLAIEMAAPQNMSNEDARRSALMVHAMLRRGGNINLERTTINNVLTVVATQTGKDLLRAANPLFLRHLLLLVADEYRRITTPLSEQQMEILNLLLQLSGFVQVLELEMLLTSMQFPQQNPSVVVNFDSFQKFMRSSKR